MCLGESSSGEFSIGLKYRFNNKVQNSVLYTANIEGYLGFNKYENKDSHSYYPEDDNGKTQFGTLNLRQYEQTDNLEFFVSQFNETDKEISSNSKREDFVTNKIVIPNGSKEGEFNYIIIMFKPKNPIKIYLNGKEQLDWKHLSNFLM